MFLLHSLNLLHGSNLLLDGRRNDDGRRYDDGSSGEGALPGVFPAGQLTSAAWEGWWHEDAA